MYSLRGALLETDLDENQSLVHSNDLALPALFRYSFISHENRREREKKKSGKTGLCLETKKEPFLTPNDVYAAGVIYSTKGFVSIKVE